MTRRTALVLLGGAATLRLLLDVRLRVAELAAELAQEQHLSDVTAGNERADLDALEARVNAIAAANGGARP